MATLGLEIPYRLERRLILQRNPTQHNITSSSLEGWQPAVPSSTAGLAPLARPAQGDPGPTSRPSVRPSVRVPNLLGRHLTVGISHGLQPKTPNTNKSPQQREAPTESSSQFPTLARFDVANRACKHIPLVTPSGRLRHPALRTHRSSDAG